MRRVFLVLVLIGLVLALGSCQNNRIPPIEQYTVPALGTSLPAEAVSRVLGLPDGGSGIAMFNNSPAVVRVVVSDTIATISPAEGFLFILPPQDYRFYIYHANGASQAFVERVENGKVRYVYLRPLSEP
jgi:hypothetical protein